MSPAWDKVRIWVVDRIWTHDLPGTGIWEVTSSNSVGDSDFLFTQRSWQMSISSLSFIHQAENLPSVIILWLQIW